MVRSKELARGRRAAAILRQNAIPFLVRLAELQEPQPPTKVVRSIGGDPKYVMALARRLAAEGLVELKNGPKIAGKQSFLVQMAPRGRELLKLLDPAVSFLETTVPPARSSRRRQ